MQIKSVTAVKKDVISTYLVLYQRIRLASNFVKKFSANQGRRQHNEWGGDRGRVFLTVVSKFTEQVESY